MGSGTLAPPEFLDFQPDVLEYSRRRDGDREWLDEPRVGGPAWASRASTAPGEPAGSGGRKLSDYADNYLIRPLTAAKRDIHEGINSDVPHGHFSFEAKRSFETVMRMHGIQAAMARVPDPDGYYSAAVPVTTERMLTDGQQTDPERARILVTHRSMHGVEPLELPADGEAAPGRGHGLYDRGSLQTTVMREGELKKRPPFVLSPTRTTRHPLDMKQTIGDTQDLRILHYAERDEGFKERLARAARVEPAKPRLHYRAPMYRFRNLPEWAAEPAVALRRSVLRTNARLPPSLADLAYNTSSLATREAKRAVSRGSADGRARGHSVGASRGHSARPDVVARAASPQAPSPEFTGRLSLSRGAVRPRGPPSEGPSRPASPQRATLRSAAGGTRASSPNRQEEREHDLDPMSRMTGIEVPGGATVREVLEDLRLTGRAVAGLRYDPEVRRVIPNIEPEMRLTTVTRPRQTGVLRPAGPFTVQRNSINSQRRLPTPADGYFRRGGGFAPPAAFRREVVKTVLKGREFGRSDLGWDGGITSIVEGRGKFLFFE